MQNVVRDLLPADAAARVRSDELVLVDVRPADERALAAVAEPCVVLENGGLERLLAQPKDRPLAFLCHHGVRSAHAAEYFRAHGYSAVYNVVGGIEAWSLDADANVPRY